MSILVLKLVLSPMLILAASLAGRRWGEAVGGWFVGLPLTSGPVVLFLALEHGAGFAVEGAAGALAGTAAEAGFCLAYAAAGGRGWPRAIAAASLAFFLCAGVAGALRLPLWALLTVALFALVAALLRLGPEGGTIAALRARPRWDLPARMLVAAGLVLGLTSAAPILGPGAAGVLATYPVFAAVLTVFAHREAGAAAAQRVLRGLLTGLFSFAAFFFVLALLLPRIGTAAAFAVASLVAILTQAGSLTLMRRRATTH
jgi:hypothetical protein